METANKSLTSIEFDFQEWADLARQDPDRFEARRSRLINEAIRRAPADRQHSLRCLQWRVDRIRELKRTPLAACIAITNMMWDTFSDLHHTYLELAELKQGRTPPTRDLPRRSAEIIPFPNHRGDA